MFIFAVRQLKINRAIILAKIAEDFVTVFNISFYLEMYSLKSIHLESRRLNALNLFFADKYLCEKSTYVFFQTMRITKLLKNIFKRRLRNIAKHLE